MGLLAVALPVVAGGHSLFWDRPAWTLLDEVFAGSGFLIAIAIAVVVHELLHAVGFRYFGGAPWRTIRFGIQWRTLTPFACSVVPVPARSYRWTAALPGIVLGAIPIIAGVLLDAPATSGFGIAMLTGAGGDAAIIWAMRRTPDDALVLDSPNALGCLVMPADSPEMGATG